MESPCQVLRHERQGSPSTLPHVGVPGHAAQRAYVSPRPPGHEGRAGMAALAPRSPQALDLVRLYSHVSENLPPYARPRFLRLQVTSCSCPSPSAVTVVLKPHKGIP